MFLFGRHKESEKKSNINIKILRSFSYTAQKRYRGYKRVYVSTYPMQEFMSATDSLVAKYPDGFSGLQVKLNSIRIQDGLNNYNAIHVIIDGSIVGTIWEDNQYYKVIRNGLVSDVYVKSELKTVLGKNEVEYRNQIVLFIKI